MRGEVVTLTQSPAAYKKCICATEECTGCMCGCGCTTCLRRKKMHAVANTDLLQGEHAVRYAGAEKYSKRKQDAL